MADKPRNGLALREAQQLVSLDKPHHFIPSGPVFNPPQDPKLFKKWISLEKKRIKTAKEERLLISASDFGKEAIRGVSLAVGRTAQGIARAHGAAIAAWLGNPDPVTWVGGGIALVAYLTWLISVTGKLADDLGLPILKDLVPISLPGTIKDVLPVTGGAFCFLGGLQAGGLQVPSSMICFNGERPRDGAWSVATVHGLLGDTRFPNNGQFTKFDGPFKTVQEANDAAKNHISDVGGYQVIQLNDGRWITLSGSIRPLPNPAPGTIQVLAGPFNTLDAANNWINTNPHGFPIQVVTPKNPPGFWIVQGAGFPAGWTF